jgi:lactoylglutathione lyase
MNIALNLVVIRVADLHKAAGFYSALGLQFSHEKHGAGPEHLSAQAGSTVFELYPSSIGLESAGVRLGFDVVSVQFVVAAAELAGGKLVASPKSGVRGITAVLQDPDGHKVEIVESSNKA